MPSDVALWGLSVAMDGPADDGTASLARMRKMNGTVAGAETVDDRLGQQMGTCRLHAATATAAGSRN
jgi:hypothetical protein